MSLQSTINEDMRGAMKAKEEQKLSTLRLLSAAIKNQLIAKGAEKESELDDSEVVKIIKSQIKQLKDANADFESAGRNDLVEANKKEIELLGVYLPEEMSEGELRTIIEKKVLEFGEVAPNDFGKVMGAVMKEVGDRADGGMVKKIVQELLSS
jgi:uncharacterized protein YqeY